MITNSLEELLSLIATPPAEALHRPAEPAGAYVEGGPRGGRGDDVVQ